MKRPVFSAPFRFWESREGRVRAGEHFFFLFFFLQFESLNTQIVRNKIKTNTLEDCVFI